MPDSAVRLHPLLSSKVTDTHTLTLACPNNHITLLVTTYHTPVLGVVIDLVHPHKHMCARQQAVMDLGPLSLPDRYQPAHGKHASHSAGQLPLQTKRASCLKQCIPHRSSQTVTGQHERCSALQPVCKCGRELWLPETHKSCRKRLITELESADAETRGCQCVQLMFGPTFCPCPAHCGDPGDQESPTPSKPTPSTQLCTPSKTAP